MADEQTSMELMHEILKQIQRVQGEHTENFRDIKESLIALREDVHGIRGDMLRHEKALATVEVDIDRIKDRLDLVN